MKGTALIWSLVLVFAASAPGVAWSEEKSEEKAPKLQIDLYGEDAQPSEFKKIPNSEVRVHKTPQARKDEILDADVRDAIFKRVPGLTELVASWDHLDRDVLVIRVRNKNIKDLEKVYPKIGKDKLTKLKAELAKHDAKQGG